MNREGSAKGVCLHRLNFSILSLLQSIAWILPKVHSFPHNVKCQDCISALQHLLSCSCWAPLQSAQAKLDGALCCLIFVGGNLACSRGLEMDRPWDPSRPKPLHEILLLHSWVCSGKDNSAISRALSLSEEKDYDLNSPRLSNLPAVAKAGLIALSCVDEVLAII